MDNDFVINKEDRLLITMHLSGAQMIATPAWERYTQNEALRIITGSHKMSSIDHLHSETKMLLVEDHPNLISAQYLIHCLDTENACHHITTMDHPPKEMKETHFTRHDQTVVPLLANTKKASLQAVHTMVWRQRGINTYAVELPLFA